MQKPSAPSPAAPSAAKDELARIRAEAAAVQKIRLSAQHELRLAKQMRAEAQKYQQQTEAKARSQAQQLILRTRMAIKSDIEEYIRKEIEETIHKAGAEIQKMLADIRAIRITAQEELATQRKLTGAAKIYSLAAPLQEETEEPKAKSEKQLASKK
jgi:hypothetical protein